MATEIERKFLLSELPATLRLARRQTIKQGYLALDGETEVRVRTGSHAPRLTIKSGRGEVRTEIELALDGSQAAELWKLTEGRRVEKTRRRLRVAGVEAEVDEYEGDLAGLVVVEVEFPGEDASRAFAPPTWFGRELTGDDRYANRSLACDGLPPE
ncbi:MAG TPA: CYTH domain-containing protein [Solirubrobacteraceae bacterium]|nr:CYTH domain-containing protein [Solirubrobacteraceae bacterium]